MQTIEAIFKGGKFDPLKPVELPEGTEVRLTFSNKSTPLDWDSMVEEIRAHSLAMQAEHGLEPDSTQVIRACRSGVIL